MERQRDTFTDAKWNCWKHYLIKNLKNSDNMYTIRKKSFTLKHLLPASVLQSISENIAKEKTITGSSWKKHFFFFF